MKLSAAVALILWCGLTGVFPTANAASAVWTGTGSNANWSTSQNWQPGIPGATGGTNNGDTASFTATVTTGKGTSSPVVIDTNRNMAVSKWEGHRPRRT